MSGIGLGTWRVIGITSDAAATLIESGFDTKRVCRAHTVSRRETFLALRDTVSRVDAFAHYIASDVTTLVTKAENGRQGVDHRSPVHPIPETVGELRGLLGVRFT